MLSSFHVQRGRIVVMAFGTLFTFHVHGCDLCHHVVLSPTHRRVNKEISFYTPGKRFIFGL